jgi:uncharacterized Tic20 family protein
MLQPYEKNWSTLCHLSGLLPFMVGMIVTLLFLTEILSLIGAVIVVGLLPLAGMVIPIGIILFRKDNSHFIDHNAKEALNFQISIWIYTFCCSILSLMLKLLPTFRIDPIDWTITILFVFFAFVIINMLRASLKTAKGEYYKYPICMSLTN